MESYNEGCRVDETEIGAKFTGVHDESDDEDILFGTRNRRRYTTFQTSVCLTFSAYLNLQR